MGKRKNLADAVLLIERYLEENVEENKLWKNEPIKSQIEKRKQGTIFALKDHIRAMVYSMLSAEKSWYLIQPHIDNGEVDAIFKNFSPEELVHCKAETLTEQIKEIHCGSRLTSKQMEVLSENINTLMEIKNQYGSIDDFYQQLYGEDKTYQALIGKLSKENSPYKLKQMGETLVTEYLRNVGYDICKPDRHICRILGSDILKCSDKEVVPVYEAIDIVTEIATELNKSMAEVDYILWAYCADGYGEICTSDKRNCEKCVIKQYCGEEK